MRNITSQIGENAGKVWQTISDHGSATFETLQQDTQLSNRELHTAIGWLARENKIKQEHGTYLLDETNLEPVIGSTAGKVYKILDIWEQADMTTMKRLSDQHDTDIYEAIGWLAREDKITVNDNYYTLKQD